MGAGLLISNLEWLQERITEWRILLMTIGVFLKREHDNVLMLLKN
jgi:hypothetical protein